MRNFTALRPISLLRPFDKLHSMSEGTRVPRGVLSLVALTAFLIRQRTNERLGATACRNEHVRTAARLCSFGAALCLTVGRTNGARTEPEVQQQLTEVNISKWKVFFLVCI